MKRKRNLGVVVTSLAIALPALAAGKKALPNQAGNDDLDLNGTVVIDRAEIENLVGADLGMGYVVVQITATPKAEKPIRISADDFTLLSRKDGERSPALSPGQIAGSGAMVVKAAGQQVGGFGTVTNGPIWGGVGVPAKPKSPPKGEDSKGPEMKEESAGGNHPLLEKLKSKGLADTETNKPVEGLLYFELDGKVKPKDLSLLYKGAAGRLVIDFK
jgi:hypothetical protein